MSHDDSRGNESPDRPHASTDDDQSYATEARVRLKIIDQQAQTLLENAPGDSDAIRHCREIRAEVDRVRLYLLGPEAVLEGLPLEEDTTESDDSDSSAPFHTDSDEDEDVPMIAHEGERVTTCLGPDPEAYEREHGDRNA
ncbi:hypothetical protein [Halomontanus rarus]|uniref:hypothetical protein n=1 Tax=Halomontanus rarus TaxID=3034020 RepID=UPI0023E8D073|nr:hypothetical protein [Halovivax sp. TS33]